MDAEMHNDEIEERLGQLRSLGAEKIETCEYRSAFGHNADLRQMAKLESHAYYYVDGTFFQMDQAQYLLDFNTTRERAIELIALLGDFEQILKIQADASREVFDQFVFSMSPCAYENLADATGAMEGYNSDGLHSCIAEGLNVCRTVGKIGCVNCFREYACDVYIAADDLELAQHQCRTVVDFQGEWMGRGNRRWLAQSKLAWIDALQGQFAQARALNERALELTDEDDVSLPLESRVKTLLELDAVRIALGEDSLLEKDAVFEKLPASGECVLFDMKRDWNSALKAVVGNDFAAADKLYSTWEDKLRQARALHYWFENRLRWIACKRLAGDTSGAESMAETVEERAKDANDWLTIRRLNEIVGSSADPSPLAVAAQVRTSATTVGSSGTTSGEERSAEEQAMPELSESIGKRLEQFQDRLHLAFQAEEPQQVVAGIESIVQDLLTMTADQMQTWEDSAVCLNLLKTICEMFVGDNTEEIWKWANSLVAPYQKNATMVSLLASIGHKLLSASDDPENCRITVDRLQQLFKRSLQLDNPGPGTWSRAGDFYVDTGEIGEAERCFARSFRLNRQDGQVAVRLANVYRNTDRPRDGLHVLDLCLREGTSNAAVAYEAAMTAFEVKEYEPMLTYLDRYAAFDEGRDSSPIPYYRAFAHLRRNNPGEALKFIQQEMENYDEPVFHCQVVKACASFDAQDQASARSHFENAVRQNWGEIRMPRMDTVELLQLLYEYEPKINQSAELADVLHDKLLSAGLMPDEYFDKVRGTRQEAEDIHFYKALISQPLDESWADSPGCLADQAPWDHYLAEWGVLAATEDDAAELVLEMQHRCFNPVAARILELNREAGPFTDSPGVVWQGFRQPIPLEDLESQSDEQ